MPTPNAPVSRIDGDSAASPPPIATTTVPMTEVIDRPPPGLSRGRWEAPAWVFYAIALAAVLGACAWLVWVARSRRATR